MTHGPRLCWRPVEGPSEPSEPADPPAPIVLAAAGEIDLATAEELDAVLEPFLGAERPVIRLDLRDVTFIDCFGLRAVQRARRRTARLTVHSPSPAVLRLLTLVHPDGIPDWVEVERADE